MRFCKKCGEPISLDKKFCPNCGTKVSADGSKSMFAKAPPKSSGHSSTLPSKKPPAPKSLPPKKSAFFSSPKNSAAFKAPNLPAKKPPAPTSAPPNKAAGKGHARQESGNGLGGMFSSLWEKTKEVATKVAKSTRKAATKIKLRHEVSVLKMKIDSIRHECDEESAKAFAARSEKGAAKAVAMAKMKIIPIEVEIIEKEGWIQIIDSSFVRSIPEDKYGSQDFFVDGTTGGGGLYSAAPAPAPAPALTVPDSSGKRTSVGAPSFHRSRTGPPLSSPPDARKPPPPTGKPPAKAAKPAASKAAKPSTGFFTRFSKSPASPATKPGVTRPVSASTALRKTASSSSSSSKSGVFSARRPPTPALTSSSANTSSSSSSSPQAAPHSSFASRSAAFGGGGGGGRGGGGGGLKIKTKTSGLLGWVQNRTQGFNGVNVTNFTKSWVDGMAFAALLYAYHPKAINLSKISKTDSIKTLQHAFDGAEKMGVAVLLDAEDLVYCDKKSIYTQMTVYGKVLSKQLPDASARATWNAKIKP